MSPGNLQSNFSNHTGAVVGITHPLLFEGEVNMAEEEMQDER